MIPVSAPMITPNELSQLEEVLRSGWITQGPKVKEFETELARVLHIPAEHVVACSSGTAALHLALCALGIGPGDEVLVPDLTYVATANAVHYCGAKPVLVDVDKNWLIDLEDAAWKVTRWTRAILPVHLYGVPVNMTEVRVFAKHHDLIVIEDAAEALGAYRDGFAGTLGDLGCFSFYGNKLVTTGEGGAVVSAAWADRVRHLRGQAQTVDRFVHDEVGFNYRMTDLHAAIGVAQLNRFAVALDERRAIMDSYRIHLPDQVLGPMWLQASGDRVAPWLATIVFDSRDARDFTAARLLERGIETRPAFVPMHRQPPYARADEYFPRASAIADRGLSLPTWVGLPGDAILRVCETVREVLQGRAA